MSAKNSFPPERSVAPPSAPSFESQSTVRPRTVSLRPVRSDAVAGRTPPVGRAGATLTADSLVGPLPTVRDAVKPPAHDGSAQMTSRPHSRAPAEVNARLPNLEPEPVDEREKTKRIEPPAVRPSHAPAKIQGGGGLGKRARLAGGVMLALVLAGTATAGGMTYGTESTDDAQIEGRVMNVAARVSGQVTKVLVNDNEMVEAGQPLLELDRSDLEVKVLAAKADLAAAQALQSSARSQLAIVDATAAAAIAQAEGQVVVASSTLFESSASVAQAKADVNGSDAKLKLAELELTRAKNLVKQGSIAAADLEQRQSQFDVARASADLSRARLGHAMASVGGSRGTIQTAQGRLNVAKTAPHQIAAAKAGVELADARVAQAAANLELAKLNSNYTIVRAPRRGAISRRTVEVGQMVGPDRTLLAVVPLDDVWIVANFKEDQIAKMKPGQPVKLTIDTFGSKSFTGKVDSLSGATGARFALLPPDNATGNYVKVVQRVPVLVKLDDPSLVGTLRPGMSAYVTVNVRR